MTLPSSTLAALAWLHEPDAVIELRVETPEAGSSPLWSGFAKGAVCGYFNTHDALVQTAAALDAGWPARGGGVLYPKSIWFSLNPCAPALLGRANNRLAAGPATGDKDIERVVALYLDFDAKRPSGVSASDQEKAVAKLAARRALDWLRDELFWPEPMVCDSGNGYHLVFRVVAAGKPAEVSALVVRFLKACAAVFQVEQDGIVAGVDTTVGNPARVVKLWGTVARKGDSLPDRPHRRSGVLKIPPMSEPKLTEGMLLAACKALEKEAAVHVHQTTPESRAPRANCPFKPATAASAEDGQPRIDMGRFLEDHGIETTGHKKDPDGREMWFLSTCLFDPSHEGGEAAVGLQPDGKAFYHCFHESCKTDPERRWKQARKLIMGDGRKSMKPWLVKPDGTPWSGMMWGSKKDGPSIQVSPGNMPEVVDLCDEALSQPDLPPGSQLFQRGGQLVRVIVLPTSSIDGVARPAGAAIIRAVDKAGLVDVLGRVANFEKYSRQRDQWEPCNPPAEAAEAYMARSGLWSLPALRGVISCPTLRADGSLLHEPGYDAASGYFLVDSVALDIPAEITRTDATMAVGALRELLSGFTFTSMVDESVALALLLTAVVRPALLSAPIINISAPVRGSGKSTLVDIAAVLSTGRRAAVLSATGNAEELEKRIVGCLLSGDPLVSLDNLNGQLASDLLCQASTAEAVKIRPLGSSAQVEIENTTLWTANGNNLIVAGDLARRSLVCRMDPGMERPEERVFDFDPILVARQNRSRYVGHALTIMRGYVLAGRPATGCAPFGSFETWSRLVREALLWAGAADPCDSRAFVLDDDPEAARLEAFLSAWWAAFKDAEKTVADAIKAAQGGDEALSAAIGAIAGEGTLRFNSFRLGKWMRGNANRVVDGKKIVRGTKSMGGNIWRISRLYGS